jgi:small subunit ribosomal protein S3
MAVEKRFISDGVRKARVEQFFLKELKRAGYGGMDIVRTPLGTQVTIFAEKPGIVIGKGGKVVRQLTQDLATDYGVESPQIEVQQVENPSFNAQIMAERLANSLERGWYFRKAGSSVMRRVMESGALGCEVVLSGKLTGSRSRVQKFVDGYVKHSGEPSETIVESGFALAVKKLGTIGVQVKIVPPDAKLPDHFEVLDVIPEAEEDEREYSPETLEEEVDAEIEQIEDVPEPEEGY